MGHFMCFCCLIQSLNVSIAPCLFLGSSYNSSCAFCSVAASNWHTYGGHWEVILVYSLDMWSIHVCSRQSCRFPDKDGHIYLTCVFVVYYFSRWSMCGPSRSDYEDQCYRYDYWYIILHRRYDQKILTAIESGRYYKYTCTLTSRKSWNSLFAGSIMKCRRMFRKVTLLIFLHVFCIIQQVHVNRECSGFSGGECMCASLVWKKNK